MERYKNVLVVAGGKDGGKAAATRAEALAKANAARVTIVDVVSPLPLLLDIPGIEEEELYEQLMARKRGEMEVLAKSLGDQGIEVDCELLQGSPAETIIAHVVSKQHDLLIKTADEPPGIFQRLFGTVGQRLMRKCPCPVWIVKAGSEHRFHRILAAIDPKPTAGRRDPLNDQILELATSLAESDDSELHVVYVWPRWTEWTVPQAGESERAEYETAKSEIDALQKRMVTAVISRFQREEQIDHVHLLKGSPADSIARLAEELKIELLVMGTVCRTGVAGFLMGNTAERVLDQVNCSVLTMKPEGFQPPV